MRFSVEILVHSISRALNIIRKIQSVELVKSAPNEFASWFKNTDEFEKYPGTHEKQ